MDEDICGSRGPRIGNEGTPVCVKPKLHRDRHEPDPSWFGAGIRDWSDRAYSTEHNVAVEHAARARAEQGEPSVGAARRATGDIAVWSQGHGCITVPESERAALIAALQAIEV